MNRARHMGPFLRGYGTAKRGRYVPQADLHAWQRVRFEQLKQRVLSRSPYYKEHLDSELEAFPIIGKGEFMAAFNDINTAGLDRDTCMAVALRAEQSRDFRPECDGYSVGLSSGTSGSRGMFVTSPGEQAEWAGYIIGKMLPFRLRRQRVALFLRSNNNLYEGSNGVLLAYRYFDMRQPLATLVQALTAFQPDVLIAPPTVLRVLADSGISIMPAKTISAAEVLEPDDRAAIQRAFGDTVHELYQCTEGFLGCTCPYGHLHLNEDIAIIEKHWIDQESGRFNPVITDLRRSTQPVVRYRLDDILVENTTPCPCGSAFTRLEAIEGRNDDIIWLLPAQQETLVPVYPDLVRRAMLLHQSAFTDYRIVQRGPVISVSIHASASDTQLRAAIIAELEQLFRGLGARAHGISFEAWVPPGPTAKCRRIQCREKPELHHGG